MCGHVWSCVVMCGHVGVVGAVWCGNRQVDAVAAFLDLFRSLTTLVVDTPDAAAVLGTFTARAVFDGVLPSDVADMLAARMESSDPRHVLLHRGPRHCCPVHSLFPSVPPSFLLPSSPSVRPSFLPSFLRDRALACACSLWLLGVGVGTYVVVGLQWRADAPSALHAAAVPPIDAVSGVGAVRVRVSAAAASTWGAGAAADHGI